MKLKCFLLVMIILLSSSSILSQEFELIGKLRNIEVLKATREDIVKIFGNAQNVQNPHYNRYGLSEGTLAIEYSNGFCGDYKKRGWNVPEFTVTRIYLTLKRDLPPKKLGIGSKSFRRLPIKDVPGAFSYEDEKNGIDYTLTPRGTVEDIEFYPKKKYYGLFCTEK